MKFCKGSLIFCTHFDPKVGAIFLQKKHPGDLAHNFDAKHVAWLAVYEFVLLACLEIFITKRFLNYSKVIGPLIF